MRIYDAKFLASIFRDDTHMSWKGLDKALDEPKLGHLKRLEIHNSEACCMIRINDVEVVFQEYLPRLHKRGMLWWKVGRANIRE